MCCLNTTYDVRLPAGVDSAGEAISGPRSFYLLATRPVRLKNFIPATQFLSTGKRYRSNRGVPRKALPTSKRTQSSEFLVHDFVETVGMFSSPRANCSLHRSAIVSSIFSCVRNGIASENSTYFPSSAASVEFRKSVDRFKSEPLKQLPNLSRLKAAALRHLERGSVGRDVYC